MNLPTPDQAFQFCLMLQAGLPASQAILYFIDSEDPQFLSECLRKWMASAAVRAAQTKLMGKSWTSMTLQERMNYALDQHYSQLAYFLFNNHYSEVGAADTVRLNTARQALESKIAGTAGEGDAFSRFISDLNQGKLRLQRPVQEVKAN